MLDELRQGGRCGRSGDLLVQGKVDGGVGKDVEESGTHACGSCVGCSETVGRSVPLADSLSSENCSGRNGGWCACNDTPISDSAWFLSIPCFRKGLSMSLWRRVLDARRSSTVLRLI